MAAPRQRIQHFRSQEGRGIGLRLGGERFAILTFERTQRIGRKAPDVVM